MAGYPQWPKGPKPINAEATPIQPLGHPHVSYRVTWPPPMAKMGLLATSYVFIIFFLKFKYYFIII